MGRIPDWTPRTYDPQDVVVGERPLQYFPDARVPSFSVS